MSLGWRTDAGKAAGESDFRGDSQTFVTGTFAS